jgi:hypothetical protein
MTPFLGEAVTLPMPRRGRLALAFLVGVGWAALLPWIIVYSGPLVVVPPWRHAYYLFFVTLFVPTALWLMVWLRFEQRFWPTVRAGLMLGLGAGLYLVVVQMFRAPGLGVDTIAWSGPYVAANLAIPVALAGGLTAAIVPLYRSVIFRAVPQTSPPRYCWRCGYDLGVPHTAACSECGVGMETAKPRGRRRLSVLGWVQRALFVLAMGLVLMTLTMVAHRVVTQTIPVLRFQARFAGMERADGFITFSKPGSPPAQNISHTPAVGRFLPHADGLGPQFFVAFAPESRPGAPAMQIRVAVPAPSSLQGGIRSMDWGSSLVITDLTPDQAQTVIRYGVPPGLLVALSERAEEVSWRPTGSSSGRVWPRELVDATPFFPPEPPPSPPDPAR